MGRRVIVGSCPGSSRGDPVGVIVPDEGEVVFAIVIDLGDHDVFPEQLSPDLGINIVCKINHLNVATLSLQRCELLGYVKAQGSPNIGRKLNLSPAIDAVARRSTGARDIRLGGVSYRV
jgi:hypothetical protein